MPVLRITKEEKSKLIIRRQYDPHNHLKNLLKYRGTVLQFVLTSGLFWFFIVLNIAIFIVWEFLGEATKAQILEEWQLDLEYAEPMGSLVVFAIVFYTGNCFVAYKDLFHYGCKLNRSISVWAVNLKSVLRSPGGRLEWQCIRHMIASQRTFYYEMQKKMAEHHGYTASDTKNHPGEWSRFATDDLVQTGLLRQEEADMLGGFHGSRVLLLSAWCQTSFMEHCRASPHFTKLNPPMQSQFLRHCLQENIEIEDLIQSTKDTVHFGVPFVYHHVVHLLVLLYLLLMPFANVFVQDGRASYWSLITYPMVVFVLLGVLEAANAMADPFGEDDCDFNVSALTAATYRDVVQLLGSSDEKKISHLFDLSSAILPPLLQQQLGRDEPMFPSFDPAMTWDQVGATPTAAEGALPEGSAKMLERLLQVLADKESDGVRRGSSGSLPTTSELIRATAAECQAVEVSVTSRRVTGESVDVAVGKGVSLSEVEEGKPAAADEGRNGPGVSPLLAKAASNGPSRPRIGRRRSIGLGVGSSENGEIPGADLEEQNKHAHTHGSPRHRLRRTSDAHRTTRVHGIEMSVRASHKGTLWDGQRGGDHGPKAEDRKSEGGRGKKSGHVHSQSHSQSEGPVERAASSMSAPAERQHGRSSPRRDVVHRSESSHNGIAEGREEGNGGGSGDEQWKWRGMA